MLSKWTDVKTKANSICWNEQTLVDVIISWVLPSPYNLSLFSQSWQLVEAWLAWGNLWWQSHFSKPRLSFSCSELVGIKNESYYFFPFASQWCGASLIVAIVASQETHPVVDLDEELTSHQIVPDAVLICCLSFWNVQRTTLEIRSTFPRHRRTRSLKNGWGWFKLWIPNENIIHVTTVIPKVGEDTSRLYFPDGQGPQLQVPESYKFPKPVAPMWVQASAERRRGHMPVFVALL